MSAREPGTQFGPPAGCRHANSTRHDPRWGAGARTAAVEFAPPAITSPCARRRRSPGTLVGIGLAGSIEAWGHQRRSDGARRWDIGDSIADAEVIPRRRPHDVSNDLRRSCSTTPARRYESRLMPALGSWRPPTDSARLGVTADITISEIAALPYATRIVGPNAVRGLDGAGTCRSGRSLRTPPTGYCRSCATCIPESKRCPTFSEAGLNNPNPTLHCLGAAVGQSHRIQPR